jgi:nucleoside-diphosphate-sugar epimerase
VSKVVVTGASGKAGRAVVLALLEHEHDVLSVDVVSPAESPAPSLLADLTDYGQTVECLAGRDAVVHLPAIPASGCIETPQGVSVWRKRFWRASHIESSIDESIVAC